MSPSDLKQARLMLKLTTQQMAEALLVTRRHIQRMEAGSASITRRTERDIRALLACQDSKQEINASACG